MKPHLPVRLFKSVLACLAVVSFSVGSGAAGAADSAAFILGAEESLTIDYADASTLPVVDGVVQLLGGTQLHLSSCGEGDGKTYTLLTGVSGLLDAAGNELSLDASNNAISSYFDTTQPGTGFWADGTLQLNNGQLQLVRHSLSVRDALTVSQRKTGSQEYSYYAGISFEDISFALSSDASGGAIYGSTITLRNNGSVTFSGNTASSSYSSSSYGGAIYGGSNSTIELSGNGSVTFSDNTASASSSSSAYARGGAIYGDNYSTITLSGNGSVTFSGNRASSSSSSSSSYYSSYGGAIYGYSYSTITLSGNGSVVFEGNRASASSSSYSSSAGGGAIYGDTITLSNNGSVTFSWNTASSSSYSYDASYSYSYGGAIYGDYAITITLSDNGSVVFEGNTASSSTSYSHDYSSYSYSYGGAIYGNEDSTITLSDNGSVVFEGNTASASSSFSYSSASGGAIYGDYASTITLSGNGSVVFEGNTASASSSPSSAYGGAIYGGTITLSDNGSVVFEGNTASAATGASGGAIDGSTITLSDNESVSFSGNTASAPSYSYDSSSSYGGAIYGRTITLSDNESVSFSGNTASSSDDSAYGGAIYGDNYSTITLSNNGSVTFSGNTASSSASDSSARGGAIYNIYGDLSIRNNDSVEFYQNAEVVKGNTYRLRSIYAYGGSGDEISLSAAAGKSITFYDSVYIDSGSTVEYNADYTDSAGEVYAQKGDIIFTGAYTEAHLNELLADAGAGRVATAEEIRLSRTSEVQAVTNLYGGRLRVEDGAIYQGYGIAAHADTGAAVWLRSAQMQQAGYNVSIERGAGLGLCGINSSSANLILADGSNLSFEIGGENLKSAVLTHTGSLTLGSNVTLNIGTSDAALQNGSYLLLSVEDRASISGWSGANFVINGGEYTLSDLSWEENTLYFHYTGQKLSDLPDFIAPIIPDEPSEEPVRLVWKNAKKTVWQVGAGGWKDAKGKDASFDNGNDVTIADGIVTISGKVAPGEVTISPTKSLTLKSDKKNPGSISGDASVTITGGAKAKVTMNEANSYTGGTTIKGATVTAKGNTSFGTGEITLSGGTLNLGSKEIKNAITLSGAATIKSGKKYAGTFTMSGGELMKGSQLNLIKDATLSGGLINGALSGTGTVKVTGDVKLGDKAKLTVDKLNITEDGTLEAGAKGLAMNGKTSVVTVSGGDIVSAGKITAASLTAKDGASIRLENKAKVQSIALSGKGMTSALTDSTLYANGSMKVAGNLTLNHSTLTLVDVAKNKPMALNVTGNLSVGSGSSLTLSGALSAANLTLDNCTLNMTGAKLQTIKVKQALTFNSNIDLNLGFAVTQKDVDKGKAFKIFTFKSVKMSTSDLHELLGISDDYCTLALDAKGTSILLTVDDLGGWNAYQREKSTPLTTTAADTYDAGVDEVLDKVSDTLVQTTWGAAKASRAFVDSIGNRGQNAAALDEAGRGAAWGAVIGATSRLSSHGGHHGADYNLSGAAFGVEANTTAKHSIGLAMGATWGKVNTLSAYTVDQDSTHIALYGQSRLMNRGNKGLTLDWSAAYGRSENDANMLGETYDWTQHTVQLDARLSYGVAINERTTARAFAGLQYQHVDSATPVAGVEADSLSNLRAEVGVGATYAATAKTALNGEVSFIGDMLRDNPAAVVGGTSRSGANPGRAGVNIGVGATHQLNESWSVNAGYNLELVPRATSHNASVGATYRF